MMTFAEEVNYVHICRFLVGSVDNQEQDGNWTQVLKVAFWHYVSCLILSAEVGCAAEGGRPGAYGRSPKGDYGLDEEPNAIPISDVMEI